MRAGWEMIRFALIFLIFSAFLGAIVTLGTEVQPSTSTWISTGGAFVATVVLYVVKSWWKVFHVRNISLAFVGTIVLMMVLPHGGATDLHPGKVSYSYGFPFPFLTIHAEGSTSAMIGAMFSGKVDNWSLGMGLFLNVALFYFLLNVVTARRR